MYKTDGGRGLRATEEERDGDEKPLRREGKLEGWTLIRNVWQAMRKPLEKTNLHYKKKLCFMKVLNNILIHFIHTVSLSCIYHYESFSYIGQNYI